MKPVKSDVTRPARVTFSADEAGSVPVLQRNTPAEATTIQLCRRRPQQSSSVGGGCDISALSSELSGRQSSQKTWSVLMGIGDTGTPTNTGGGTAPTDF